MNRATTLRGAVAADREGIEALLHAARLPLDGLAPVLEATGDQVVVAVDDAGALVGVAALEIAGGAALLRSVAVAAPHRGAGLGAALVRDRLRTAVRRGLGETWLLTTTAAAWFPRFGFVAAARASVPDALAATAEFRGACPASATLLRKALAPSVRVLVLCTGNSARSQVGEALLATHGVARAAGVVHAASAGSRPVARVNPGAVAVLARHAISWDGGTPKTIDQMLGDRYDLVITVCDDAKEACPVIPGATMVHWGLPDPAHASEPTALARAFDATFAALDARVRALLSLPLEAMDRATLRREAQAIHDRLG